MLKLTCSVCRLCTVAELCPVRDERLEDREGARFVEWLFNGSNRPQHSIPQLADSGSIMHGE